MFLIVYLDGLFFFGLFVLRALLVLSSFPAYSICFSELLVSCHDCEYWLLGSVSAISTNCLSACSQSDNVLFNFLVDKFKFVKESLCGFGIELSGLLFLW